MNFRKRLRNRKANPAAFKNAVRCERGPEMEKLEPLNMLAPLYPDMFAWASESRGYLYDYVVEGDLLRFTTALANQGEGHMEIRGGAVLPNGNQEVYQRLYHDDGTFEDFLAGEFTYHPGHGHIHFDGYATYNLRERLPDDSVGDIVATGGKVSFCLIDIADYNGTGPSNYHSCGQVQGVSAGWSDVYGRSLSDQWINITGIDDGNYWLEIIIDPDNQLIEGDEDNNVTQIPIVINGGPGDNGDIYEPNNSFAEATSFGFVAQRHEDSVSIHSDSDVDYYQFQAVEDGDFDVTVEFTHALGNLDAFIYDSNQQLIVSGTSTTDLEQLSWTAVAGETYFLNVIGAGGETNGYEIDFHGPGDLITEVVSSTNVPVTIPDGVGANSPGTSVTSTLEGPDITLSDLNLIFGDLDHSWLGDLHFELTSPQGTTAVILTSQWESGGGLLGSEDDFLNTVLDDQAPTNLGDGSAPFTGSFNIQHANTGNNPLSVFNGESALGTWTITIQDFYSGDTGTLRAWSLMFTGLDNNPGDAFEQNDAFPQATWLGELGLAQHGDLSIHVPEDEDYFRFQAAATGVAQVDTAFTHALGDLDLIVYDQNLVELGRSETATDNESLAFPVQTGQVYYVRVRGDGASTNDYSLTIHTPESVMEAGLISGVNHLWQRVDFGREFVDPVVIVSPPTFNGADPATARIRNVTSTGFDVQIDEWDYLDGTHADEAVGYFVIERGTHTLDGGTVVYADRLDGVQTGAWYKAVHGSGFTSLPVVVAQVESTGSTALTARVIDSEYHAFGLQVQAEEAFTGSASADVHWLGITTGADSDGINAVEAGFVEGVTTATGTHNFANTFANNPLVFASLQSSKDFDPVTIRLTGNPTTTSFGYLLEEEQSADTETGHGTEEMGYFAIAANGAFRSVVLGDPDAGSKKPSGPGTSRSSLGTKTPGGAYGETSLSRLAATVRYQPATLDRAFAQKQRFGFSAETLPVSREQAGIVEQPTGKRLASHIDQLDSVADSLPSEADPINGGRFSREAEVKPMAEAETEKAFVDAAFGSDPFGPLK